MADSDDDDEIDVDTTEAVRSVADLHGSPAAVQLGVAPDAGNDEKVEVPCHDVVDSVAKLIGSPTAVDLGVSPDAIAFALTESDKILQLEVGVNIPVCDMTFCTRTVSFKEYGRPQLFVLFAAPKTFIVLRCRDGTVQAARELLPPLRIVRCTNVVVRSISLNTNSFALFPNPPSVLTRLRIAREPVKYLEGTPATKFVVLELASPFGNADKALMEGAMRAGMESIRLFLPIDDLSSITADYLRALVGNPTEDCSFKFKPVFTIITGASEFQDKRWANCFSAKLPSLLDWPELKLSHFHTTLEDAEFSPKLLFGHRLKVDVVTRNGEDTLYYKLDGTQGFALLWSSEFSSRARPSEGDILERTFASIESQLLTSAPDTSVEFKALKIVLADDGDLATDLQFKGDIFHMVVVHQPFACAEKRRKFFTSVSSVVLLSDALFQKAVFNGKQQIEVNVTAICQFNENGKQIVNFYATSAD